MSPARSIPPSSTISSSSSRLRQRPSPSSTASTKTSPNPPRTEGQPMMTENLFTTFADRVLMRVDEVDANQNCKWPLSEDQRTLLRLLRPRQGRARAIALGDVCERMKTTPRLLKEL